jgi:hypothetical protein
MRGSKTGCVGAEPEPILVVVTSWPISFSRVDVGTDEKLHTLSPEGVFWQKSQSSDSSSM